MRRTFPVWWVGTTVFLFRDTSLPAQFPFDPPLGTQRDDTNEDEERDGGATEEGRESSPASVPTEPSEGEQRDGRVGGGGECSERDTECHHLDDAVRRGPKECLGDTECPHPDAAVRGHLKECQAQRVCLHPDDAVRGHLEECQASQVHPHSDGTAQRGDKERLCDQECPDLEGMAAYDGGNESCHGSSNGGGGHCDGGDRTAGGSMWTDFAAEGFGSEVEDAAYEYVRLIDGIEDAEVETWRKVCHGGDRLLRCTGSVRKRCESLMDCAGEARPEQPEGH